jgi:hypothetical protein
MSEFNVDVTNDEITLTVSLTVSLLILLAASKEYLLVFLTG